MAGEFEIDHERGRAVGNPTGSSSESTLTQMLRGY